MFGILCNYVVRVLVSVDCVKKDNILTVSQIYQRPDFFESSLLFSLFGKVLIHHLLVI